MPDSLLFSGYALFGRTSGTGKGCSDCLTGAQKAGPALTIVFRFRGQLLQDVRLWREYAEALPASRVCPGSSAMPLKHLKLRGRTLPCRRYAVTSRATRSRMATKGLVVRELPAIITRPKQMAFIANGFARARVPAQRQPCSISFNPLYHTSTSRTESMCASFMSGSHDIESLHES